MTYTLYPYQQEGVEFILSRKYTLIGYEMGLGKSFTALSAAVKSNSKTLIVCPAFLKNNWIDEIQKFFGDTFAAKVVPYTQLKNLTETDYDFIIADEAHYLKNKETIRTQMFHDLVLKMKPSYVCMLTGTPISNRVPEFWSLLQILHYGGQYPEFQPYHRLYYKFCNTFAHEHRMEIHRRLIIKYEGLKNKKKLIQLLKPVYLRKKSTDVLDLPDKVYKPIRVHKKNQWDKRLEGAFSRFEVNPKDAAFMTVKAANALAKVEYSVKYAKEIIDTENKVVIFTDHVAAAEDIASHFGIKPVTGKMSPDIRSQYVKIFNNSDNVNVLVATFGSLSVGINLTSSSYMVMNDFPWVPSIVEQAEKRIHRIGQDKTCFYYQIFTSDIDEKIFKMIKSKQNVINQVNEEN